ncbi:MAG: hypothetical protein QW797_04255 [Thermoproteota archaeon]
MGKAIFLAAIIIMLRYSIQAGAYPSSIPSTYTWSGLKTDTVQISYSFSKNLWYGGTNYLRIEANGPGVYSDTKSTMATVTIQEGEKANVYVCGDDRNPVPNGWTVQDKYLKLEVDGVKVYELGKEYWWARCYSKAATIGPGKHEVKLTIHIVVKVVSNVNDKRDLAYAAMDVKLEGSGTIQAGTHEAEAALDGEATHMFTFKLPDASSVETISWRAVWNSVEKTGDGLPGSVQKAVFQGVNRDNWVFTSPVVIRIGESTPSVEPSGGYSIDAVYDEGSGEAGILRVAVAVSNRDEVGFTSGEYLATTLEYLGPSLTGCTSVEDYDAWANSYSNVHWAQRVRFYGVDGWVVEEVDNGVENGCCTLKKVGGGVFSRKVVFSSRNRVDELMLTLSVPQIRLHFDSMRAEPIGPTDLGLHMLGETVELRVRTSDCLGEYSRVDVYRVSESSPGVRKYSFSPLTGVYRGITSTAGGNVTFTVEWSSYSLAVKNVSNVAFRSGVYWARSGSTVRVTVSARYSHDGSPAAGVMIRDSDGNRVSTGLEGEAEFMYVKNDCEAFLTYVAVDEQGNRISGEAFVKIVFTRIRLEALSVEAVFLEGSYYACNDASPSISVRAVYSHSLTPVAGALVEFEPSGSSALTGLDGVALLRLTGRDRAYDGRVEASDGFLDGEISLRIVFTRVLLEASRGTVSGKPGEEVEVTVWACLSFNGMLLNGIEVRWVEEGLVEKSPASFRLKIPEKGVLKASFETVGFLPCVEPCVVTLFPNGVRFGEPNGTGPRVVLNSMLWGNYSYRVMLNIMDLLNLTIPMVVWHGNGSIAYGVRIGVVSLNGTVIRSSVVSSSGVSFNWTESKPGVYRYVVKALEDGVGSDLLSIEAVFTAFNITANYILDLNGTRLFFATAYWAHDCSPVGGLPVHTSVSGKRTLSDADGRIMLSLNDSDYNGSCVEKIVVFKWDAHASGIWRTVGDCSIRIVRLSWSSPVLTGDQYGFSIILSLYSEEDGISLPLRIMVGGYPPEIVSSIRVLQVESDNSSMTVFLNPTGKLSFSERLALRIDHAEYDGVRVRVRIRSLAEQLVVRGVRIRVANSTLEETLGDLQPGSCFEPVLELPVELRANPVVLIAYSENTFPSAAKVWRKQETDLLPLVSVTPLLAALALRLRSRSKDSRKPKGENEVRGDAERGR